MVMDNIFADSVQVKVVGVGHEDTLQEFRFPPLLQKNRIHVWTARYEHLDRYFRNLKTVISPEELHIASTFRKSADARKYILRHGVLRIILGNYTNLDPARVSLFTGKNGKPELDPQDSYSDIFFNMSHTSEMFLIGVTRKHRIGVDIVKMDPSYQFQDSAEYILTPAEKAFMQRTDPAMRYQIFFRIWALKEAILKVNGGTLTMMKNTDVSEIIQDVFSSPWCSEKYLNRQRPFFIWQFKSGSEHRGVIATN
jgi:4'-phosphopantetheinyl transferase